VISAGTQVHFCKNTLTLALSQREREFKALAVTLPGLKPWARLNAQWALKNCSAYQSIVTFDEMNTVYSRDNSPGQCPGLSYFTPSAL